MPRRGGVVGRGACPERSGMAESIAYLAAPEGRFVEEQAEHVMKRDLTAADGAAGVLSLKNGTGRDLFVTRLVLRVTTKSTAACTVDGGIAATEVSDDTLIDGLDVGTAAVDADNVQNAGTNGKKVGKLWPSGQYLTVSKASGATAGMVGQALVCVAPV